MVTSFATKEKWVLHVLYSFQVVASRNRVVFINMSLAPFCLDRIQNRCEPDYKWVSTKVKGHVKGCFLLCSFVFVFVTFVLLTCTLKSNKSMIWKRNPKMLPSLKHQCLTTWTKRWRVPWFPLCSQIETAKQTDKWKQDKASHPAMKMFTILEQYTSSPSKLRISSPK